MRSLLAVLLAYALLTPEIGSAQSATAVRAPVADSAPASTTAKKKKKGLFGKVKGLADNRIVRAVAKTALCTAVPGGQVIAAALDAVEKNSVTGAASAGTGGGGGCTPGMGGMAALGGRGAAGLGAAAAGALGAPVPGVGLPGQPFTGMPGMAMSPEQLKQIQEQYAKMGMNPVQLRAMQQMMAGAPGASPAEAAAGPGPEPVSGAPALSREKGKILVRNLPWLPASDALQPGSEPMFGMVMREVASAIQATGKHYKIEARVEEQGGKAQNRLLSQKRAAAVLAALSARGVPADRLTVADGKADKNPRIIVSEGK